MAGDEGVRVSDADRERVARQLAGAQAEGRLTLAEFDERVRAAHGAVTRADLDPLTTDLPSPVTVGEPAPAGPGRQGRPGRPGLRAAVAVWATVSAINLVVWLVVALAVAGPVYPWWIWVAGPWGVMLGLRAIGGRAMPRAFAMPAPLPGLPGMPCGSRPRR